MLQVPWGIGGVAVPTATAFLSSTNRRAINPRTVIGALVTRVVFAPTVPYRDLGRRALKLLTATAAPAGFANSATAPILIGRALAAGTPANLPNAAIAGMLVG